MKSRQLPTFTNMKILVATRGNEIYHIESFLLKLQKKYTVDFYMGQKANHPEWFQLARYAEDYNFYFKTLQGQGEYWKERIFDGCPFPRALVMDTFFADKQSFKPAQKYYDLVSQYDIVIATSLFLAPLYDDFDLCVAAKKLGKPLIGFVSTWDTPTTKCKIQVMPDMLFCWNEQHKEQLITYHGVPEHIIYPIGDYCHEKFMTPNPMQRHTFLERLGLAHDARFVTYLCSSTTMIGNEDEARIIHELSQQHQDTTLLVKVYPKKPIPELHNVIAVEGYSDEIYSYSDAIYGINTSAMIEAMLVGAKVYAIPHPEERKKSLHFAMLEPILLDGLGYQKIKQWLGMQEKNPSDLALERVEMWYSKK